MNVATFNGRRLDWRGLLALILVPLLVAGTVLAGVWRFDSNLRRVQAAVVNHDVMVELNGQKVPLGRQLSAALVDSKREQNFTWVLADDAHARDGLASGAFAAVVTIPENFSAAATSYAGSAGEAKQATITIETSPVAGIAETALGQSVADAAAQSLNTSLTSLYLENVYLGFNTMGAQFVTVADGARQLADGSAKLTDGLGQASSGANQLADGLGQASAGGQKLSAGGKQLSSGGTQLASGAKQLADGLALMAAKTKPMPGQVAQLASGTKAYTDGVTQYVDGTSTLIQPLYDIVKQLPDLSALFAQIDTVMADFPAQAASINTSVKALVAQLDPLLTNAQATRTQVQAMIDQYSTARAQLSAIANGTVPVPCPAALQATPGACDAYVQGVRDSAKASLASMPAPNTSTLDATLAQLDASRDQLKAAAASAVKATAYLDANSTTIQAQWKALRGQIPANQTPNEFLIKNLGLLLDGGAQLKANGPKLADGVQQLSDGVPALVDGIQQSADGAAKLSGGVSQYTSGVSAYTAGVTQFADGVSQAHTGSVALASGLTDAHAGSVKLTDGMTKLADGLAEGAKQIPSYTDAERVNLGKVVASPISTTGLDGLVTPMAAAASLLLVLALWLGALATYVLIKPVDPRNAASSSTTTHLVLRALLPGAGVAAVQAVLLGALGAGFLGLSVPRGLGLVGVLLVAGLAFAAVNHALAAWAGVWGRLASGAMLLVTTVTALTYSAPGIFGALRPLSPMSPGLDAARAVITWHSVALPVVVLLGWLAVGVIAGAYRIVRSRTVPVKALALAAA